MKMKMKIDQSQDSSGGWFGCILWHIRSQTSSLSLDLSDRSPSCVNTNLPSYYRYSSHAHILYPSIISTHLYATSSSAEVFQLALGTDLRGTSEALVPIDGDGDGEEDRHPRLGKCNWKNEGRDQTGCHKGRSRDGPNCYWADSERVREEYKFVFEQLKRKSVKECSE